jgi:hypothetical protein
MNTLHRPSPAYALILAILIYGLTLVFALAVTPIHTVAAPSPVVRQPSRPSEPPLLDSRTPVALSPALLCQLAALYDVRSQGYRVRGLENEARYHDGLAAAYLFLAAAIEEGLVVLPVVSKDAPAAPAEP